jgi:hypothetical protein
MRSSVLVITIKEKNLNVPFKPLYILGVIIDYWSRSFDWYQNMPTFRKTFQLLFSIFYCTIQTTWCTHVYMVRIIHPAHHLIYYRDIITKPLTSHTAAKMVFSLHNRTAWSLPNYTFGGSKHHEWHEYIKPSCRLGDGIYFCECSCSQQSMCFSSGINVK